MLRASSDPVTMKLVWIQGWQKVELGIREHRVRAGRNDLPWQQLGPRPAGLP